MTHRPRDITVTVQEMDDPQRRAALPEGWTAVTWHWPDRDFTECREHLETDTEPTGPDVPVDMVGTLRFDAVECGRTHPVLTERDRAVLAIENDLRQVENLSRTLRLSAEELRLYIGSALEAGASTQEIAASVGPSVDRALDDIAAIRGLVSLNDPAIQLRQHRHAYQHPAPDQGRGISM